MYHPITHQTLGSLHQADLLAEAARERLARMSTEGTGSRLGIGLPYALPRRPVRLRHGLATMLATSVAVLTALLVSAG